MRPHTPRLWENEHAYVFFNFFFCKECHRTSKGKGGDTIILFFSVKRYNFFFSVKSAIGRAKEKEEIQEALKQ
jgi:hypothetical protein